MYYTEVKMLNKHLKYNCVLDESLLRWYVYNDTYMSEE